MAYAGLIKASHSHQGAARKPKKDKKEKQQYDDPALTNEILGNPGRWFMGVQYTPEEFFQSRPAEFVAPAKVLTGILESMEWDMTLKPGAFFDDNETNRGYVRRAKHTDLRSGTLIPYPLWNEIQSRLIRWRHGQVG